MIPWTPQHWETSQSKNTTERVEQDKLPCFDQDEGDVNKGKTETEPAAHQTDHEASEALCLGHGREVGVLLYCIVPHTWDPRVVCGGGICHVRAVYLTAFYQHFFLLSIWGVFYSAICKYNEKPSLHTSTGSDNSFFNSCKVTFVNLKCLIYELSIY